MRIENTHVHTPPQLADPWRADLVLRSLLARHLAALAPPQLAPELLGRLARLGQQAKDELRPAAALLNRPGAEPLLLQYDEWGRRVDEVRTSEGWRAIATWFAERGIPGEAYGSMGQERWLKTEESAGGPGRLGAATRLYAHARTHIVSADSHVALCPISMTDGAILVISKHGTPSQQERLLPKLLHRGAGAHFAGQWMTERTGGSDVALTETSAKKLGDGDGKAGDLYLLDGFKWFASAADGHIALALARTDPDKSRGARGLSLFIVPLRRENRPPLPPGVALPADSDPHSSFNGIRVHRLKNKLGTKFVPTAELELNGAVGELVGEPGRGVALIAGVLNVTRLYSCSGSVAALSQAQQFARQYSLLRQVRGEPLASLPLHMRGLARVAVLHAGLSALLWHTVAVQSQVESTPGQQRLERRVRLLTPTAKAFAAAKGTEGLAVCIESVGGQGYMHESVLTTHFRDALVERVWEGTPSVLALDVHRVFSQSKGAALSEWAEDTLKSLKASAQALPSAQGTSDGLVAAVRSTLEGAKVLATAGLDLRAARSVLDLIAVCTGGEQLLAHAVWLHADGGDASEAALFAERARRWLAETGAHEAAEELRARSDVATERAIALGGEEALLQARL